MHYSDDLMYSDGCEDPDPGTDSDNNSDLEEIEFALYSQIHFEFNSSLGSESPEPKPLPPVGPGGDNSNRPESKSGSNEKFPVIDNCESVCELKSLSRKTSPVDSKLKIKKDSSLRHKSKKKQKVLEEQMFADDEEIDMNYFVSQLSSGTENEAEDSIISVDLKLNIEETPARATSQGITGPWGVLERDETSAGKFSSGPRGSRYYAPLSVKCRNCRERGHLSRNCPRPQKHLICFLCGEVGHNNRSCPNTLCFNCHVSGHSAKECSKPRRRNFDTCHRCEMMGHIQAECPDLWRQYHITITDVKLAKGKNQPNIRVFCYNCGENGHFGFECEDDRINKYTSPTYPFIARYQLYSERHSRESKQKEVILYDDVIEPRRRGRRKMDKIDERKGEMLDKMDEKKKKRLKKMDKTSKNNFEQTKQRNDLAEQTALKRRMSKQLGIPAEDLTDKHIELFQLKEEKKEKRFLRKLMRMNEQEQRKIDRKQKKAKKAKKQPQKVDKTQSLQQNIANTVTPKKTKKKKKKTFQNKNEQKKFTQLYRQKQLGIIPNESIQLDQNRNSLTVSTDRGFNITLPQLKKGKLK